LLDDQTIHIIAQSSSAQLEDKYREDQQENMHGLAVAIIELY
jgi:hypothetical protein